MMSNGINRVYVTEPNVREEPLWIFAILPAGILVALTYWYQPSGLSWTVEWVPSLGIDLSFRLTGLSYLFAAMISGVGVMVQLYAYAYLKGAKDRWLFHSYLTLFMLAMLGVVVSDNILLLFVFWELTTLTSYLLIGFNHEKEQSRKNALQSLIVTGAGGLALLAGLILLGQAAGSFQLSVIISEQAAITQAPIYHASMVLVMLGALTKSAQFPFHFWLPNAMAAPTPVSAYLHSSTMVKAGVFLLALLSPVYSETDVWFYTLTTVGGFTALWCALLAVRQTDLKLMLAYSTNVVLGMLVLLLGIGSELALVSAFLLIIAHAFYKAALFMVVGNIDKATGTRDIRLLRGLKSVLVISLIAAAIAALSKSGIPPFMGFLSKEYMYKALLEVNTRILLVLLVVNALMVSLAMSLIFKPFLSSKPQGSRENRVAVAKPVETSFMLWIPPALLALGSIALPVLALGWLNSNIVAPGVQTVSPDLLVGDVKLWQGINLPLILSGLTLGLGVLFYKLSGRVQTWWDRDGATTPVADTVFHRFMASLVGVAQWQTNLLQHKKLGGYVLTSFAVLAILLFSHISLGNVNWSSGLAELRYFEVVIAAIMVASALLCIVSTSRLLAVASLGVIGFMTTLVFMLYSAPDVAKTLLLVETLLVVFVALLMRHLPLFSTVPKHPRRRRALHAVVAIFIGFAVTMLLITITSQPIDTSLSQFFAEQSVPGGHGRNIVNVILVDFRAFDTFGEVVVVVIAGLSAASLVNTSAHKKNKINSLIFATTAHIVAALMLVFSLYLLLRGHNAPGGGFIGALIAVIGLSLLMFAESPSYVRERLYYSPFGIAMVGIAVSALSGVMSLLVGLPYLTGLWWKEVVPLGTPLLFDVGIYLSIIGGVMGMLLKVNEELD